MRHYEAYPQQVCNCGLDRCTTNSIEMNTRRYFKKVYDFILCGFVSLILLKYSMKRTAIKLATVYYNNSVSVDCAASCVSVRRAQLFSRNLRGRIPALH